MWVWTNLWMSPTLPSSVIPPLAFYHPISYPFSPSLEIVSLNTTRRSGERCSSPAGLGRNFVHFSFKSWHSGCNKFRNFPENQMTKCYAKFRNFMQNLETRRRWWIAKKHRIAIPIKTVIGQYGSSTVLQTYCRWMISQISSVSFFVYTLLCVGSWSTGSWSVVPKLGSVRRCYGCKI